MADRLECFLPAQYNIPGNGFSLRIGTKFGHKYQCLVSPSGKGYIGVTRVCVSTDMSSPHPGKHTFVVCFTFFSPPMYITHQ